VSKPDQVGVGMIGVGSNGAGFLQAFGRHPHATVVAIAEPDEQRRSEMAARHNVPNSFARAEELLRLPEVDLVSIHAPDRRHAELTLAALDAGKQVFVEKPLGTSIDQITTVIRRTDATGKLVAVGQVLRTWPHFRRLKTLVDSGRLGTLFYVSGNYLTDQMRSIPGIQQKAATSYSPAILTLGVHVVDVLRWLAGDVVAVQAYRNEGLAFPGNPFDECIAATYRFAGGAVGQVATCWGDAAPLAANYGVTMHGSLGTVDGARVRFADAPEWIDLAEAWPGALPEGGPAAEVDAVIEHLRGGPPVPCDAREGGRSAIACLAAVEAARQGAAVAIPTP